jgi:ribosomal protein S18 acetylase RimI-like enzyme
MTSIVRLHREGLGYSFNSQLGPRHLAYIYSAMTQDDDSLVAVAREGDAVIGVVSATLDAEALAARLMSGLPLRRWLALLMRLALRPRLVLTWLADRRAGQHPVIYGGEVVRPYLSTIAVDGRARRGGVGRALVSAVDDFFTRQGCRAYYLDTLAENTEARAFYGRLGFVEVEQRGHMTVLVRELQRAARP